MSDFTQPVIDIKGTFTLYEIDTKKMGYLENVKTNYFMNLNYLSEDQAQKQLIDLLSDMQGFLEKYFKTDKANQIKDFKVEIDGIEYTFYTLQDTLRNVRNKDIIRIIANQCFFIYDTFTKILGNGIPTTKRNVKKKLTDRLFSLIKKDDAFYQNNINGYKAFLKLGHKPNLLTYTGYTLAKMPDHDLNCNILIIGSGRASKSTLLLHLARLYYSERLQKPLFEVDRELIKNNWVFDKIVYTKKQGLKPIKNGFKEFIGIDELYFIGDKRLSMDKEQIQFISWGNAYASRNNISCGLIQNLEDLDTRIYSNANLIYLVYERGEALVYCRPKNFPIIKNTFEFEKFKDYPSMLSDMDIGLSHLKGLSSYIGQVHYADLSPKGENNILWNSYQSVKDKFQAELTEFNSYT